MAAKKNLTVRLDDETREALEIIANREMRPLANQINYFLKQSIGEYLKKNHLALDTDASGTFVRDLEELDTEFDLQF